MIECDKVNALPRADREGLTERVTFQLRPGKQVATSHVKVRERASSVEGTAEAKGWEQA